MDFYNDLKREDFATDEDYSFHFSGLALPLVSAPDVPSS